MLESKFHHIKHHTQKITKEFGIGSYCAKLSS